MKAQIQSFGGSPAFKIQRTKVRWFSRLPLRFSERRLLLISIDFVAINCALLLTLSLRPEFNLTWRLIIQRPIWFLLISILWFPIAFAFDVYDLKIASQFSTAARGLFKAGLVTAGLYLLIPYLTPALPTSCSTLFLFFLFILTFPLVLRAPYLLVMTQPFFNHRALIIGTGSAGQTIVRALLGRGDNLFQVLGFADDTQVNNDCNAHSSQFETNVLGDRYRLLELIKEHCVTTLILALDHNVDGELLQVLTDSLELGVEILPMPVLYEQLTGRVPIEHVGDNWYIVIPILHPGTSALYQMSKRVMDIVLASIGLILLAPVFPFIAMAIYLESPGPIFYTQERVGKGGRVFRAFKFRSMVPDAEKGDAVWAEKNDQRVTWVGSLLRKTHVDEFPQFLNIIKGEMSAVGPRPERPEFVEELAREIPFYRVRHAVKPGMAGWGLVKQGYGASKEDAFVKLQYDLYYIKHQSIWLDTIILIKTIIDTFTFRGRA
jgi:exopolysaccharide biosynthesis polyprenyl glycosylphosphotransferase